MTAASSSYRSLRELSAEVFGRELFLPVAVWILEERRRRAIYFSELRAGLSDQGVEASAGPLSKELGELESLRMISRRRRQGRYVPYWYRDSQLWKLVKVARGVELRSIPGRHGRRS